MKKLFHNLIYRIRNFSYQIYMKINPIDMDKAYTDQAGTQTLFFGDRRIDSFYLPLGIQMLDSEYSKRIMDINESKEDPGKLKKEIKENPHLHYQIKLNLLLNLENRINPLL